MAKEKDTAKKAAAKKAAAKKATPSKKEVKGIAKELKKASRHPGGLRGYLGLPPR